MLFEDKKNEFVSNDDIWNIIEESTKVEINDDFGFIDNDINDECQITIPLTESCNMEIEEDSYIAPETYIESYVKEPAEKDLLEDLRESLKEDLREASRVMDFLVKEEEVGMFYEKYDTWRAMAMDMYACKLLGEATDNTDWKENYYLRQFKFMLESLEMPELKKQWARDLQETEKMVKEAVVAACSKGGPQADSLKYNKYLGVKGDLLAKYGENEDIIDDYTGEDIL